MRSELGDPEVFVYNATHKLILFTQWFGRPEAVGSNLADLFEGPHLGEDARSSKLATLAEVPTDELAAQLRRTVHVLEAFAQAAEEMDVATYVILCDADERAREALKRLEV